MSSNSRQNLMQTVREPRVQRTQSVEPHGLLNDTQLCTRLNGRPHFRRVRGDFANSIFVNLNGKADLVRSFVRESSELDRDTSMCLFSSRKD